MLDCFEVEPTTDEFFSSYSYEIKRDGIKLLVTIWQYESTVQFSLYNDVSKEALVNFAAYVRGRAEFVNDKRGRFIEISDCVIAPSRFWYIEAGDVFNKDRFSVGVTLIITVNPHIRLELVPFRNPT